jgi:UPF0755 protein
MKKILLVLSSAGAIVLVWFLVSLRPVDRSLSEETAFVVGSGQSIGVIAANLEQADVIRSAFVFKLYARLTGSATRLQAFALSPSMSVAEIIDILRSGKTEEFFVTIPEGYTVADIDRLLASKGLGKEGDIIDCAFRCDFSTFGFLPAKAAGTPESGIGSRLEGYLFPETYSVSPSTYVPKFFLERMLGTFRTRIVDEHAGTIAATGRSFPDVVIMASLVEEESRHNDERAVIAGILWKRLDSRVVLGVDATTRYEVKKRTEPLTKTELENVTPYNTRRTQGLPPSAIANAGESSFVAALKLKESVYWYYLHGKDGQIRYAVTNDEHNLNRAKYLK